MTHHELEPGVPICGTISREGDVVSVSIFGGHTIEVMYLDGERVMREGCLNGEGMKWGPWEALEDV